MKDDGTDIKVMTSIQLRMEACIKMLDAATLISDGLSAEQSRQSAHEQLDIMLDARQAVLAGFMKNLGRK